MVNLIKYNQYAKPSLLLVAFGLSMASGFLAGAAQAADISGNPPLPASQKCATEVYISDRWNENTKRSNANNALAYKKLICQSGREAFLLIYKENDKMSYKLVNHDNDKLSDKSPNMCTVVDNYCNK